MAILQHSTRPVDWKPDHWLKPRCDVAPTNGQGIQDISGNVHCECNINLGVWNWICVCYVRNSTTHSSIPGYFFMRYVAYKLCCFHDYFIWEWIKLICNTRLYMGIGMKSLFKARKAWFPPQDIPPQDIPPQDRRNISDFSPGLIWIPAVYISFEWSILPVQPPAHPLDRLTSSPAI